MRLSEYAGRVVRNWYVVLITVVVAVLLVVLHTVGTGKQSQAQATVFLGTPLTPTGGSAQLNSVVANPTSAQAYLHTSSVLDAAAAKAGIKSGTALRSHLSVTALQSTTTKSTGATPNMQITVQGPYDRTSAVDRGAVAGRLADRLGEQLPGGEDRRADRPDRHRQGQHRHPPAGADDGPESS